MNDGTNNLLADVLAEAAPADFREALLSETLRLARRRRQFWQVRRAATVLVVLVLGGVFIWQWNLPQRPAGFAPLARVMEQRYQLVHTQPLPADAIITTQPFDSRQMVASENAIGTVQTSGGHYRVLSDAELLALLGPRPALLIRTGPHSEELVFANPEDENGFPLN